jgi:hypothetical protein
MSERMTVVEVQMQGLAKALERHVSRTEELIGKLDLRADGQDLAIARLLAGIAVLMFIGQLAAPVILRAIGIVQP